jgi:TatD DNase family protein
MNAEFIDTHAHLADPVFGEKLEGVVARAEQVGVTAIVVISTSASNSSEAIRLAESYPMLYASVGIQPNHVAGEAPEAFTEVATLSRHRKVVAIGETGLDEYWDDTPFALQQEFFRLHLELALQRELPVVIHMREGVKGDGIESCSRAIYETIRGVIGPNGTLRGVMHSYTGTGRMADLFLELGLHISFAGMLTFKNSQPLRDVAAKIPVDRLLLETDSPYLTPHPHRGKYPNEPANVLHTARCLSETRQISFEDIAALTTANARKLFRLPPSSTT